MLAGVPTEAPYLQTDGMTVTQTYYTVGLLEAYGNDFTLSVPSIKALCQITSV